jgi:ribosomal protein L33
MKFLKPVSVSWLLVFFLFHGHPIFGQNSTPCSVAYDGIDLKTKKYTFKLDPAILFHYTPPALRNEVGEQGLLSGTAQILQIEESVFLNMNIEIFSRLAPRKYGEILHGSLLRITLIDGRQIDLKCQSGSDGENYVENNSYIYPVNYILDKSARRALGRLEVDKIGIQWTSGFEEYVVYEVDFFLNQMACLKSKKPN